jgi:hypothetical protein
MTMPMTPASRSEIKQTPFAEMRVQNYAQLIQAFDARRKQLDFNQLDLADRCGLPDGYVGKLIAMSRNMGRLSFGLMMDALDLEIVVRSRSHHGECNALPG